MKYFTKTVADPGATMLHGLRLNHLYLGVSLDLIGSLGTWVKVRYAFLERVESDSQDLYGLKVCLGTTRGYPSTHKGHQGEWLLTATSPGGSQNMIGLFRTHDSPKKIKGELVAWLHRRSGDWLDLMKNQDPDL